MQLDTVIRNITGSLSVRTERNVVRILLAFYLFVCSGLVWGEACKLGIEGDIDLFDAQRALNQLGYDSGIPDGLMGSRTESALREFQNAEGLLVSGQLDETTKSALHIDGPAHPPRNGRWSADTPVGQILFQISDEGGGPVVSSVCDCKDGALLKSIEFRWREHKCGGAIVEEGGNFTLEGFGTREVKDGVLMKQHKGSIVCDRKMNFSIRTSTSIDEVIVHGLFDRTGSQAHGTYYFSRNRLGSCRGRWNASLE